MQKLLSPPLKLYLRTRYHKLRSWIDNPIQIQEKVLTSIIDQAKETAFGQEHDFQKIKSAKDYKQSTPIRSYDLHYPYIMRMLDGEPDVLWPGKVSYFAKSSGTTSDRSKYLPVTKSFLRDCLTKGSWDTMSIIYHNFDEPNVLEHKSLIIGGSLAYYNQKEDIMTGDVSAIMLKNMPIVSRPFYTPDIETAIMACWEEKLDKIARITSRQTDVGMVSGVPTWNIVLFNRILELTGASNMSEVWPQFETYIHGGVNFAPYRAQFDAFFPDRKLTYQEVYNASEGYFATQIDPNSTDMLLLLDNDVYYEFVPYQEIHLENPTVIDLAQVETGVVYSMIITTSGGLFRYDLGDTIVFTSVKPYKLKITGRTKSYINAFGEEVMVHNTDQAIEYTSHLLDAQIKDYTVAPKFLTRTEKGRHEWYIEFSKPPQCLASFATVLDETMQKLNSDYAAKRNGNLALESLVVHQLRPGTFENWLKSKKTNISSQSKIPRLSNDRQLVDQLLTGDHKSIQLSTHENP